MPTRGKGSGLRFAVPDDARGEQIGIIEDRAISVRERVTKLTALINRSGRLRRGMARDAAWKRELAKQFR